ncbi:MAG TPA: TlpA disulfide reductase family protein [Acidimicrobiales bacterium]|nr:TlpA disulfide reductase family protein [Acidimicrobiales bacterium]
MSEAAAPSTGARLPGRLRLLILVAVLVTGVTVYGAVQAIHYSNPSSKPGATSMLEAGFFTPKSTTPVPFRLSPLSGKGPKTALSQLLGKPLVLNMWSSTCTVCQSETPAIERVARYFEGRVTFVGIDSADERGAALSFVRRYGVTYRQLFDPTAAVVTGYGISALPVTVFVTAGGRVVGENLGALSTASLGHYLSLLFGV